MIEEMEWPRVSASPNPQLGDGEEGMFARSYVPRLCKWVDDLQPGDVGEIRFVPRDQRQTVEQGRRGEHRVCQAHLFLPSQFDGVGGDAVIEQQFENGGGDAHGREADGFHPRCQVEDLATPVFARGS